MGSAAGKQGGQMRPQQPQQAPMGGQTQQGKGPGLPMPQQPQMGGNIPYQPVGANNGPFHQNPVQPVNQPPQMPAQTGPVQPGSQPMQQPAPVNSLMDLVKNAGGQPMPQQGKGPQSPFNTPAQARPVQPGQNPYVDYTNPGQPMQQPVNPNIPQPIASLGGKGPQSPFHTPAQTGPVQGQNNNPAQQGKGPQSPFNNPNIRAQVQGQNNNPGSMQ